jgi:hypothetical protein
MPQGMVIETGVSSYRRCVDLPSGTNAANGERVHQWDCAPYSGKQLFELERFEGNWYRVGASEAWLACAPLALVAHELGVVLRVQCCSRKAGAVLGGWCLGRSCLAKQHAPYLSVTRC